MHGPRAFLKLEPKLSTSVLNIFKVIVCERLFHLYKKWSFAYSIHADPSSLKTKIQGQVPKNRYKLILIMLCMAKYVLNGAWMVTGSRKRIIKIIPGKFKPDSWTILFHKILRTGENAKGKFTI